MPSEVCYKFTEDGPEFKNLLIEYPDAYTLRDLVDGQEVVHVVAPDEDDETTAIITVPAVGPFAAESPTWVSAGDLPAEFDFEVVSGDEGVELDVLAASGERLIMVVRHVSCTAITASRLIPRALIHPDLVSIFE